MANRFEHTLVSIRHWPYSNDSKLPALPGLHQALTLIRRFGRALLGLHQALRLTLSHKIAPKKVRRVRGEIKAAPGIQSE